MSDKIILDFGATDLADKGPGQYSGGTIKIQKDYATDTLSSARQFLEVARTCLNDNKIEKGQRSIQLVPGVVCAAFSCELSMKWLIHRHTGSEVKGHLLDELFENLAELDQNNLKKMISNFNEFVIRNRKMFIDARYHHEQNMFSFREQEILYFANQLISYIESQYLKYAD